MKRFLLACALFVCASALAAEKIKYVEASELTLVGKLMPTENPYHRVDTCVYKGFNQRENKLVRMSAGLAVAFRTNSRNISVRTEYGDLGYSVNNMGITARGYDIYIKKNGQWLWAGANCAKERQENGQNVYIVRNMNDQIKECLLYLPLFSEEYSVQIGVDEGAEIEAMENPFRHRIAVFGSSFTHGTSTSRSGMAWPAQFARMTGLQMLGLGCSGNCTMQAHFAEVLADVDADAFIFDSFSNPNVEMIRTRLFPFIEKLQEAHPGVPLIFQRTIYRETRNFSLKNDNDQRRKIEVADSMMTIALKKYPDVYYIRPNATSDSHETSVDGVHPDNYGYTLWAESIVKPVKKILRKYNIK